MEDKVYLLVYYEKPKDIDFTKTIVSEYLNKNGFKCTAGYWGCPWYFVDIENMEFKPGRPGVGYGKVLGEHAITFEEFKTIFDIYKKYHNKSLFDFTK